MHFFNDKQKYQVRKFRNAERPNAHFKKPIHFQPTTQLLTSSSSSSTCPKPTAPTSPLRPPRPPLFPWKAGKRAGAATPPHVRRGRRPELARTARVVRPWRRDRGVREQRTDGRLFVRFFAAFLFRRSGKTWRCLGNRFCCAEGAGFLSRTWT